MEKLKLKLAKPAKVKGFAQESTRWADLVEGLKQTPGAWHRIKGANLNDAVTMRLSLVKALAPYKLEVRVRHQRHPNIKVFARVIAQRGQ
jgi:hypothetical protein